MIKFFRKISALALLLSSMQAFAGDLPDNIEAGLENYKKSGPKSAIQAWVVGSALEGSKDVLAQANGLRQIEDYYGKYQDYSFFKAYTLGAKSSVYLFTMNYEMGVVFVKFYMYETPEGKNIVQTFLFNTAAEQVWPHFLIFDNY